MNQKKQPVAGGMFGPGTIIEAESTPKAQVDGPWSDSPLVDLQNRAKKLEESVAVLTELVQGLVKRVEAMEGDLDDDDSDLDELDEDEEDESDL